MKIDTSGASSPPLPAAPAAGATLPTAFKNQMQQIADDPAYAAGTARLMTGGTHYAVLNSHVFDPIYGGYQAQLDSIEPDLASLYRSDQAQGKSGAETVADMLRFEIAQPQSYWSAADPDHLLSNDPKAFAQAQLAALQDAMASKPPIATEGPDES
jgi:hypothetical protein